MDDEILSPRREIVSVPYAFRALDSDSLGGFSCDSFSLVGHTHDEYVSEGEAASITADMIADGEITDSDIAPGAGIDPSKIDGTAWTTENDGSGSGLDADKLRPLSRMLLIQPPSTKASTHFYQLQAPTSTTTKHIPQNRALRHLYGEPSPLRVPGEAGCFRVLPSPTDRPPRSLRREWLGSSPIHQEILIRQAASNLPDGALP